MRKPIDWIFIQKEYDSGKSYKDLTSQYGISNATLNKAKKTGIFKPLSNLEANRRRAKLKPHRKLTTEERQAISARVKQLFKDRPELHPNRKVANNRDKMTYPERLAYDYLVRNKIDFVHNARIISYYVDFLIGKTAIEIDGEYWHKNKAYDIKRDQSIRSLGFNIIRIRAKDIAADKDGLLMQQAVNGKIDGEFLNRFRQSTPKTEIRCICGNPKINRSVYCRRCADKNKVKFADKNALVQKLEELDYNYRAAGKYFGVSDNMIRKYCRRLEIPLASRKFRHKGL